MAKRQSRRFQQLAKLALDNPSVLLSPKAIAEVLKVSYPNAKMILCRYRKLLGNNGNRLCPECLEVLTILTDSLVCSKCGYEHTLPRIFVAADSTHEIQSGIWPNGTAMTEYELRKVAPRLQKVFSSREERAAKIVLSQLEEILKSFPLNKEQTTFLAQKALFHYRILVYERGKLRIFKAVLLTLLDGASMSPLLCLGLRDYMSNGPFYTSRKTRKRKQNAN